MQYSQYYSLPVFAAATAKVATQNEKIIISISLFTFISFCKTNSTFRNVTLKKCHLFEKVLKYLKVESGPDYQAMDEIITGKIIVCQG